MAAFNVLTLPAPSDVALSPLARVYTRILTLPFLQRLRLCTGKLEAECEGDGAVHGGQNGTGVDLDLDGDLLARFSCLGTTDRDVLVTQLHSLLGAQLSKEGCEFFMEIGSWNLQAAVGAYYDFYGPVTLPTMAAKDVTLSPGQRVPPNTVLSKVWRVSNTGTDVWQSGTSLTLQTRNTLCGPAHVPLPSLGPGQEAEVSVSLLSPSQPGTYRSIWRLTTPSGAVCAGQSVCAVVSVGGWEEGDGEGQDGDLAVLTQQLAAFSTSDNTNSFHDNSLHTGLSAFQADSGFHSDGVGSSPPPPSPVNPHMSHPLCLPSLHGLCEMEEQQHSPSQ